MTDILADMSDLPAFSTLVLQEDSDVARTLRSWLTSTDTQLQICACLTLGNVARSDKTCILFVQEWKIHAQLISILSSANDSHILYAAIGFLKNLALPSTNKVVLGEAGLLELLPRLWKMDVLQQVQFSSVSFTRQLIINTSSNVARFLQQSSPPATISLTATDREDNIHTLTTLFMKSDIEPTKIEISRLFLTICRVLFTPNNPSITSPSSTSLNREPSTTISPETFTLLQESFFSTADILKQPLSYIVTQQKWPALRSEAFFVFALMARSPLGASLVSSIILGPEVFPIIEETILPQSSALVTDSRVPVQHDEEHEGKDVLGQSNELLSELTSSGGMEIKAEEGKGKEKGEMKRVDKMNVLVLVTEVLKNINAGEKDFGSVEKEKLERLIREGGKSLQ
jgi:hypothetical protein